MVNIQKVRAIVTSLLLIDFLIVAITGIGLLFVPFGERLKEVNWTFLGMSIHTLLVLHKILGLLMVLLVIIHFSINYKMYKFELKALFKSNKKKVSKKE